MMKEKMSIDVEMNGVDETIEKLNTLRSSFGTQVMISGARDCTFNIHPSQTTFISGGKSNDEETEKED